MRPVLLIDFGSTYTKVTAVDLETEELLGTSQSWTTINTDIGEGLAKAVAKLEEKTGVFGGYYYENNQIVKGKGVVEFENNLYFVKQTGAVYTTHHLMVPEAKTNGLIEPGLYDFEDDGRLIR